MRARGVFLRLHSPLSPSILEAEQRRRVPRSTALKKHPTHKRSFRRKLSAQKKRSIHRPRHVFHSRSFTFECADHPLPPFRFGPFLFVLSYVRKTICRSVKNNKTGLRTKGQRFKSVVLFRSARFFRRCPPSIATKKKKTGPRASIAANKRMRRRSRRPTARHKSQRARSRVGAPPPRSLLPRET